MYDPQTVAFTINRPWPARERFNGSRYWPHLITIWHVDPQTDGTDNSCGWPWAHMSEADRAIIADMAEWDEKFPYYGSAAVADMAVIMDPAYRFRQLPPGQAFGFIAAAWMEIAARRDKRRRLSSGEISYIMGLAVNPHDGLRSCLNDQPTKDAVRSFLGLVMRQYLTYHRPWWRHPRWHIHHWKFQVHPWQSFRRWMTRCHKCGHRFAWGEGAVEVGSSRENGKRVSHLAHSRCVYDFPAGEGR